MKIISWNCNGAFRKKVRHIDYLDADIFVIQECEDPARSIGSEYKKWAKNYLWIGTNRNRGLGVFAKEGITLSPLTLDAGRLECFLPCKVNETFILLAVWTREANSPTFKYIGQLWKYIQKYKDIFKNQEMVLIGDLNSNACWDVWDRWWNHSDVVRELEDMGMVSLYHTQTGEKQGEEKQPTFYMYRRKTKSYHIDYAFISRKLINKSKIKVGAASKWLEHSDHMPLVVDLITNHPDPI